ncbi:putative phosphinothricin acetyltransferase YwnH [bacterium BMS3Abin07]|nr:putative phosphinothricin acetyltransferase YwnH [bacterium BMS3Abin07]GBE32861.1 putative phosphinothricin acetyltransferase YwnH [bacterium BMS3Bbin05]
MQEIRKFLDKDGNEITLRPAEPEDFAGIIRTVRSTSLERSYVLMELYAKNAESEKQYISGIDRQNNLLLAAITNGSVIGCLAAIRADSGKRPQTAHILDIGIHILENYRGLGIGSRMLEYTIDWAQERGFKKLAACIFTTNKRSLHLFRKAGFTEECISQKHIRIGHEYIDEMCMVKFLD